MISAIITGGQTGADQAGWRAARRFGIETGGAMPYRWLTESGPRPDFAREFGAVEGPFADDIAGAYRERTRANVERSHVLLWFGDWRTPGGRLTSRLWQETRPLSRSFAAVIGTHCDRSIFIDYTANLIRHARDVRCHDLDVMVAGNRESKARGLGVWVEAYLCDVFRNLGFVERSVTTTRAIQCPPTN